MTKILSGAWGTSTKRSLRADAQGNSRGTQERPGEEEPTTTDARYATEAQEGSGEEKKLSGIDAGPKDEEHPGGEAAPARRHRGPSAARGEVKDRIRIAARAEFIEHGYDGATIRAIARRAQCDSGLVSYYFGSKQKLFRACMDLPLDPAAESIRLLSDGPEGAARRVLNYAVHLYEETLTADTFFALMRALMTDAATSRRFQTYIRTEIIDTLGVFLGAEEDFGEQLGLALGTIYGIASMRYIVKLEPLASMPSERFIDLLEPILQERVDAFMGASAPR